ncbi:MAG TPA: PilZ domain-containing protein [Bdellovibrionota bacterium]|nr:PilZ domain-containing protein [Bdellovibrionota bacterium]
MTDSDDSTKLERRRSIRRKEPVLVRFEGDNFSIYSRAMDISAEGAFLATHYLLDPGTPIQVHFVEPAGQASVASARVVRITSRTVERGEICIGLGVEFVEKDPTTVE